MAETTQFILVRHGQTASNGPDPDPRLSGWADLPLSPLGWQQAAALWLRFLNESNIDFIYSSPLRRARVTAQKIHHPGWTSIRCLPTLMEINCGLVDGLPLSEVRYRCAGSWEENLRQTNDDFRWPGGESYREFRARSLAALDSIAQNHPGQRGIVVTHCGLISQVVGWLQGVSPAQWEKYRPGNASLTELDWGRSHQNLVSFDDRQHLASMPADIGATNYA